MIENILPQLQDEANHILNSLTGSQLSVQFLTQKPKASRSKKIIISVYRYFRDYHF